MKLLKVTRQGAPIIHIDNITIVKKGEDFLAVYIDMKSKWCAVCSEFSSGPREYGFDLMATRRSTDLKEGKGKDEWTEVQVLGLPGWEIFSVCCERYTVKLVLIRQKKG